MEDNQQHPIVHREPFLSIDKVMLFFYVLIPFLPRFGALDAMGFHWMLFAILNAVVTFYLINKNSLTRLPINFKPFTFYLGWITISIISIIFAYNKIESIVHSQETPSSSFQQDALNALVALGITRAQAENAIKKITSTDTNILNLEELIKKALKAI
jgi:hypothetical protein